MVEVPSNQDFMGSRNHSNIPMNFFSFQREPSLIFMPLPFYNKSVMSEFFDKANKKMHTDFGFNEKKQEDKKDRQKVP